MQQQYYTQGQLSALAGITDGHLNNCIREGLIPGPNVQFAQRLRKVYDQATADRVLAYFREKRELREAATARALDRKQKSAAG